MQYTQHLQVSLDLRTVSHDFLLNLLVFLSFFQIGLIFCNSDLSTSQWAIYDFYDIIYDFVIIIFGLCEVKSAQLYGALVFWGLVSVPGKLIYGVLCEAFRLQTLNSIVFQNSIDALLSSLFAPTYLNFFLITLTSWKLVLLTLILIFHSENSGFFDDSDKKDKDSDEKVLEKMSEIDLA